MSKIFRVFSFISYFAVAVFSTNATAALVIDFSTGLLGSGGTIGFDANGIDVTGTDIFIGALTVEGTPVMDGVYVADALLNFSTAANEISVIGTVDGLVANLSVLLTGSFDTWSFTEGLTDVFVGGGPDVKSCELLCALGVPEATNFEFFGFSLQSANGNVISTDIVNTVVPVPAAVWLFGSGLLGLVGVARRRRA